MNTLLLIFVAVWLVKSAARALLGLAQIFLGLAAILAAAALYLLAHAAEAFACLWATAFPTNTN